MKKYYLTILFISISSIIFSQDNCLENIEKAKTLLTEGSPFNDEKAILKLIEPCAEQGNAQAQNYLGLAYLNGIGVEKNTDKAYQLILSAANNNYPNAQYNLGRLYKYGTGCELNFNEAINWFQKALANGNQRAAYSLGYMYYKGYGVDQDYEKAIAWFERSDDYMAVHFLGLSHYLGHGVPVNKSKAIGILEQNPILNSQTLLEYIKSDNTVENNALITENLTSDSNELASVVSNEVISDIQSSITTSNKITIKDISNNWSGKIVQYDWSGLYIEQTVPIQITFEKNGSQKVNIQTTINEKQITTTGIMKDSKIHMDSDFTFNLNKLYSSNPNELSLDYTVLSLGLEKKELNETGYLTGYIDTYINSWSEYGQPIEIILKPTNSIGKGDNEESTEEIDDFIIEALAAQEDQFIKLYPIPFKTQLTVQYQLESQSNVYVELIGINGVDKIVILPTTEQNAGDYTYTIAIDDSIKQGIYIVRLLAGNQTYTRTIFKK